MPDSLSLADWPPFERCHDWPHAAIIIARDTVALEISLPQFLLVICCAVAITACGDDISSNGPVDAAPTTDAFVATPRGQFPASFLWGTATAAYQVEGDLHDSDWFQWEGLCDVCSGASADDGPKFLDHYQADFANAASISTNAFRMSLDWSRLFPTRSSFPDNPDPAGVQLYHDILDSARQAGLEPMVTLVHFALPSWLQDLTDLDSRSGFVDISAVDDFEAFADWAASEYGSKVDYWITINEMFVMVGAGWISGDFPPGKTIEVDESFVVLLNLIRAHARGYDAIHRRDTGDADGDGVAARVSISKHNRVFLPKDPTDPDHVRSADMLRYLVNHYILQALVFGNIDGNFDMDYDDPEDTADDPGLRGRLDFIGLNYYGVSLVVDAGSDRNFPLIGFPLSNDLENQGFPGAFSDFGWTLYSQGLRPIIDELEPYGLPIIITENGIADANDNQRPRYIIEHLYEINEAIDDGIDIRGYFHWSLIDNFEWGSGFCPRFGLFRVDYDDPARPRTMGEGASVYKRIIDANTVSPDLFVEYPSYGEPGFCPRVAL